MANGDASAAGGRANGLPTSEPRWPSSVAVLVAVALYALLPKEIVSGSFGGYVFASRRRCSSWRCSCPWR